MAECFENANFMDDLAQGRAIRSVVYANGIATLAVYEWSGEFVQGRSVHFPAEQIPQAGLKDKFCRVGINGEPK